MKKHRSLRSLVVVILFFTLIIAGLSGYHFFSINHKKMRKDVLHIPLKTGNQSIIKGKQEDLDAFVMPVSIYKYKNDILLISNYQQIFVFEISKNLLTRLKVNMNGVKSKFVPTSLTSNPEGDIFIANYTGNNILLARINLADYYIDIIDQISDSRTISPEGIDVRNMSLAVANYDGNNLQIFKKQSTNKWRKYCEIGVPMAHGVVFWDKYLFVTSLQNREIIKVETKSCKVISKTGSIGWQDWNLMWPTSISSFKNKLLISDAHKGQIIVFDPEILRARYIIGQLGPGRTGLNMPYATIRYGQYFWTLSTFGNRIHRININTGVIDSWDTSRKAQWKDSFDGSAFLNAQGYKDYTLLKEKYYINNVCYYLSYGSLKNCNKFKKDIKLPFYFTQLSKFDNKTILSSPQSSVAFLLDKFGHDLGMIEIGYDAWVVDGILVSPSGKLYMNSRLSRYR